MKPDHLVDQRGASAKDEEKWQHACGILPRVPAFDVTVVGLGGMGSAAAAHASMRGKRVLGLEQFQPGHTQGSSHGRSRVIRLAYFEHPAYVPLLRRAYELWRRLEREAGRRLLQMTGGLMIGASDSEVVSGSLRSAREHDLDHEMLDAAEIRRRFPPFTPQPGVIALHEHEAGVVFPEEAIRAHLDVAARHGAELRFDERVEDWRVLPSGSIEVRTTRSVYDVRSVDSCARRVGAIAVQDRRAAARGRAADVVLVRARWRRGAIRARSISHLHLGSRRRRAVLRLSRRRRVAREGGVLQVGE